MPLTERKPAEGDAQQTAFPKRTYSTPVLAVFGDVRSLTLGGSIGVGDSSGDPFNTKSPGT